MVIIITLMIDLGLNDGNGSSDCINTEFCRISIRIVSCSTVHSQYFTIETQQEPWLEADR